MKAGLVAAASVALVGLTACGASRASSPAPVNADVDVRDAYLASIHRGAWFDGSDDDTLLRIGSAVCTNLDHDSSVEHIVRMAAANHIPPKQVRELMRAATEICPQHQAAVEGNYTRRLSARRSIGGLVNFLAEVHIATRFMRVAARR